MVILSAARRGASHDRRHLPTRTRPGTIVGDGHDTTAAMKSSPSDPSDPHAHIGSGSAPTPHSDLATGAGALPAGTRLQEFEIIGLVGEGGFSIVYRARDTLLGRDVALKEYLPASVATRSNAPKAGAFAEVGGVGGKVGKSGAGGVGNVVPRSQRHRETFELGLRSFVNEAQLLASFDHPSLVKVYRFWEENGTAYMVMPLYSGPTLREWLQCQSAPPSEAWLRAMLEPLLDALELMHANGCYHRDIAPDNVLLVQASAQGSSTHAAARVSTRASMHASASPSLDALALEMHPVLLDFGAARRVIGDATQALTVILKPGFAPIEQYADDPAMRQGPWTDIYALCALLYQAIHGKAPVPSVARLVNDRHVPARELAAGRYGSHLLEAIDAGMAVRPENRPASIAAFRALLTPDDPERTVLRTPASMPTPRVPPAAAADTANFSFDGLLRGLPERPPQAVAARAPVRAPTPVSPIASPLAPPLASPRAPPHASRTLASALIPGRRNWWPAAVTAGVVVAAGAASWLMLRSPAEAVLGVTAPAAPSMASAPPVTAESPAGEAAKPHASTSSASSTQGAQTPASAANTASTAPTSTDTPRPFSVGAVLEQIVAGADPTLTVTAQAAKPTLIIERDALRFSARASESGYVYVFNGGTDQAHFYLLFPNTLDKSNRIMAGRTLALPRDSKFTAAGPPGKNRIVVMVSRSPRDFTGTGLKTSSEGIPEFDLDAAARRWSPSVDGASEGTSPFVGTEACGAEATACPKGYGAAWFEVSEVR
jgi:serine/threonine protein kinase